MSPLAARWLTGHLKHWRIDMAEALREFVVVITHAADRDVSSVAFTMATAA
jgi:hypothetical protein